MGCYKWFFVCQSHFLIFVSEIAQKRVPGIPDLTYSGKRRFGINDSTSCFVPPSPYMNSPSPDESVSIGNTSEISTMNNLRPIQRDHVGVLYGPIIGGRGGICRPHLVTKRISWNFSSSPRYFTFSLKIANIANYQGHNISRNFEARMHLWKGWSMIKRG